MDGRDGVCVLRGDVKYELVLCIVYGIYCSECNAHSNGCGFYSPIGKPVSDKLEYDVKGIAKIVEQDNISPQEAAIKWSNGMRDWARTINWV